VLVTLDDLYDEVLFLSGGHETSALADNLRTSFDRYAAAQERPVRRV
jgi:hypothetical protein